jgi:hypothetical protein
MAVGDGDGGVAEDSALHFVLVIAVGDEPGAGDQGQGDEEDAVACRVRRCQAAGWK